MHGTLSSVHRSHNLGIVVHTSNTPLYSTLIQGMEVHTGYPNYQYEEGK